MAEEKGKILKVDAEAGKVLLKTGVSDSATWGKGVEVMVHVEIDYSTATREQLLTWVTGDRRIACRRAHLVPLGAEKCEEFTAQNPYKVKAEDCSKELESAARTEAKFMKNAESMDPEAVLELAKKLMAQAAEKKAAMEEASGTSS